MKHRLKEIKARLQSIEDAPWKFGGHAGSATVKGLPIGPILNCKGNPVHSINFSTIEGQFVAHAPSDIAFLLKTIELLLEYHEEV